MPYGAKAQERLARIATCSQDRNGVTRFPFTKAHHQAIAQITHWMERAGLSTSMDSAATLIGRLEGPKGAKTLLLGSHQDSVRNGGRYDGIMGIALACLALQKLKDSNIALPFAVEVLAFADEEGARFPTALMGPRALAGSFDPAVLDMCDRDGISLADALAEFGGAPQDLHSLARQPDEIIGYIETHIEQGPVLEVQDLALGIVTAICGIERNEIVFSGETGHAGTVPMKGRKDALVAAARFIAEVSDRANTANAIRATVGALSIAPDVVNAIPNSAKLTLEIRSEADKSRADFAAAMRSIAEQIAARSGTEFTMRRTYEQPAVQCAPGLTNALITAAKAEGHRPFSLPSGATHDASAMADLCPIAMLFVRCTNGLSHHPDEFASDADMGAAINTLAIALTQIEA
ncbi:MAG: M20 family metallo-hydrolase [Paracoccaceae bacterium]